MPEDETSGRFDLAVIGAGVVGLALARRMTLDGARVVILEKAVEVLDGASKGNSAILHTGFDAPPGSLEAACLRAGHAEYLAIRERLNLPLIRSGALVLAWSDEEEAALPALIAQAQANGIADAEPMGRGAILALEPALSPRVRAGFRVPREYLIDPWSAPHGYLAQALANGAVLRRGTEVTGGAFDGGRWRLETTGGPVDCAWVANAAGLWGDVVDERLTGRRRFEIRPRKGQFVVYDKTAARLARHILLPVPSATTKGIVVCRTAFGNLLVGPTAEEQTDRTAADLVPATLAALHTRGEAILPKLAGEPVTACYAGLRPATEEKGYRVDCDAERNLVTLGGIRSTGLSAALGLAAHVAAMIPGGRAIADPLWPRMPVLAEDGPRDWQTPGHGGIVCHCELVTRREIEAALSGPAAAASLAGLKRRTRVTMGRCQGFYCSAALARLTQGRLVQPMLPARPPAGAASGAAAPVRLDHAKSPAQDAGRGPPGTLTRTPDEDTARNGMTPGGMDRNAWTRSRRA